VSQPVPQQIPRQIPRQVPEQQSRRPSPLPRPERLPEPPPVPLPRHALRSGPDGREPALVTVDGSHPVTPAGALAVLALPPVATLPRRRRASPSAPAPSRHAIMVPSVLRQPWASDVGTMRRMLAGLHRMS
jgi:hypothetical protein